MTFKLRSKKGQVFLILAIVVLIYIILLSATVFKITESPYFEPAPDHEKIMDYIDNAIKNFYELGYIGLSQYSNGENKSFVTQLIQNGLSTIKNYMVSSGLPTQIELVENQVTIMNSSTTANPAYIYIMFNVSMTVDTPDVYYSGVTEISIRYEVSYSEITGSDNYVYITEKVHDLITPVYNADITTSPPTTVVNLDNGSYKLDLQTGQTVNILLPHNISIWLKI